MASLINFILDLKMRKKDFLDLVQSHDIFLDMQILPRYGQFLVFNRLSKIMAIFIN